MAFLLTALIIIVADQVSKWAVLQSFRVGESVSVVPGFFDLTFVLNRGAAFSLFATLPEQIRNPFFICVSITAVVLIVFYRVRYLHGHRLASFSLALILGGAIGNLIDRMRYGVVIDFFDAHIGAYHWPVFNVADSAITVGVTLMCVDMLLEWRQTAARR
ncbi:MAG TPA: signal peptidase II [Candidatus Baltobacteraceae bacterium]|nr:signal peptidase II [Candidatus Baltobacteraceae bacterium]